ncbi:ribosomal protein S5-alanine N-acetyltransferase [Tepidibacillus marianensis]|uniref:ribosomal protein S5-alanine N-acetyltransferase n=1 Tax=Tepidibacillus marianensis TaxID=3131995 RepID=UPI0030D4F686
MSNQRILPYIEGNRVLLKLAEESDIPEIIDFYLRNKEHLAPFEPVRSEAFYTKEYWKLIIDKSQEDFLQDRSLRMFLFEKSNPTKVIGTVNFNNFVRGVFQACHLGYSLDEYAQGKGYMTEAIQLGIDYIFHELNLHRIMANYMPHNRKSGQVLKRLGFVIEGYARDYLMINGKWEDHILTSLTNHRWE